MVSRESYQVSLAEVDLDPEAPSGVSVGDHFILISR